MTKKELMGLPHLAISEEEEGMFVHIHVEEGYKITDFKDGDDILQYYAGECIYAPIQDTYPEYRIITDAEDAEYKKQQEEAMESEMKEPTK